MLTDFLYRLAGKGENEWEKLMRSADPETKKLFAPIVKDFFIPDDISVAKFSNNWHAVIYRNERSENVTKTIEQMDLLLGIPLGYPNWFVAAYPDVVSWAAKAADSSETKILEALGFKNVEEYEKYDRMDEEKHFKHELLGNLVNYYLKNVDGNLECSNS